MALSVAPVNNPTLTPGVATNTGQQISGVIGSSGLNVNQTGQPQSFATPAVSPPAPTQQNNNTQTNTNNTGSSSSNPGLTAQGIVQEYGTAINAGNALYGQNEAYNNPNGGTNINDVNNAYAAQAQQYQDQVNNNVSADQSNLGVVNNQRTLSLSELADQIRGQHQGLQAQLGAVGAGNSSASLQGDQALAHEQNTQNANVDQQAQTGATPLLADIQKQQNSIPDALNTLQTAKQQQIDKIVQTYQQTQTQLQQAIAAATGEEKRELGLYASNVTVAASQALTDLNNQVNQAAAQISQAKTLSQNVQAPQAPAAAQAPAPIQTPVISPFTNNTQPGNTSGNATAVPGGLTLSDILQQQQQQNTQPTA